MTIKVDAWLTSIDRDIPPDSWTFSYAGADVHLVMNHQFMTDGMAPRWAYLKVDEVPSQIIAHDVTYEPRVLTAPAGMFEGPLKGHPDTHELIAIWQEELHDYWEGRNG